MKISIVIPIYNQEVFLPECLDSVCGQTQRDIEIICVDDGSTDGSLEILQSYAQKDARVRIFRQENKGAGPARNLGIEKATGDFLAFMDPDDYYPDDSVLSDLLEVARKENASICGGSLLRCVDGKIEEDTSKIESGYLFDTDGWVDYSDYQFDYGYWRFIYSKRFIDENGLSFPDYRRQQDPPFMVEAFCRAGRFYALKRPSYVYRVSHKTVEWNQRKAHDVFCGIDDVIAMALKYGMEALFERAVRRINAKPFRVAAAEMGKFADVREAIFRMLNRVVSSQWLENIPDFKLDAIYRAIFKSKDIGAVVSVVVPVYKVEKYLPRCLDSILEQTYPWIEVVCVNDGSPDGSRQILSDYTAKDKRIRIIDKENGGLSSARNAGIAAAKADFILFVDSDDRIEKETIEHAVAKMTGEMDVVCWGVNIVDDGVEAEGVDLSSAREYHRVKMEGRRKIADWSIAKTTCTVWNKLFKRDIVEKYGIMFSDGLLFEDNEFTYNYFAHCDFGWFLDEYLYNYVQRPGSIMERVRTRQCKATGDALAIFDRIYKHYEKYGCLQEYKSLLSVKYSVFLKMAYGSAPDEMRETIRHQASEYAKDYEPSLFSPGFIDNIRNCRYELVGELNVPTVSVVIPMYNAEKFLHKSLGSLAAQTFKACEFICVDDGSTDKTCQIVKNFAAKDWRFRLFKQDHGFAGAARNLGISKASGECLAFLDADDFYSPDCIERLYKAYKDAGNADVVVCGADIYIDGEKLFKPAPWFLNTQKFTEEGFFTGTPGNPWNKMFRMDFVRKNRLQFLTLRNSEDLFFVYQALALSSNTVLLDEPLIHRRVDNLDSLEHTKDSTPLLFLDAYRELKTALERQGLYETNRPSMIRRLGEAFIYNLKSVVSREAKRVVYTAIKEHGIKEFGLLADVPSGQDKMLADIRDMEFDDFADKYRFCSPVLSVVIPVFNAEDYIKDCLDSVLSQNVDLEVICVDDCSTDNSAAICETYAKNDGRVTLIKNDSNKFAGVCRNIGLERAKGKYVHFLDADDKVESGAYRRFCDLADTENLDLLRGISRPFDDATGEIVKGTYYDQEYVSGPVCEKSVSFADEYAMLVKLSPVPWIGICRRSLIVDGKLQFNDLKCSNDVSFFIDQLMIAKRVRFVRDSLVLHRINNKKSLMGIRYRNFDCVLKSTKIVEAHTRHLPLPIRKAIMVHMMNALPQWIKEVMEKISDKQGAVRVLSDFVMSLDLEPFKPDMAGQWWYKKVFAAVGDAPFRRDSRSKESNCSYDWGRVMEVSDMIDNALSKLKHANLEHERNRSEYEKQIKVLKAEIERRKGREAKNWAQRCKFMEERDKLRKELADIEGALNPDRAKELAEIKSLKAKLAARSKDIAWLKAKLAEKEE